MPNINTLFYFVYTIFRIVYYEYYELNIEIGLHSFVTLQSDQSHYCFMSKQAQDKVVILVRMKESLF